MAGSNAWESFFDFSTDAILEWEENAIRDAARNERLEISDHAVIEAIDIDLKIARVPDIVIDGTAVDKDLPGNFNDRKPGIAFLEKNALRRRPVLVKVGALYGYIVVTVYEQ